ncbi:MAG: LamB/YcsF family protein [Chloroflexota bacterium]|nr:LamB/YcsF family protein [Chloroflexota bacterium]
MTDSRTTIDLNSDLGEGFGPWRQAPDDDLMPLIASANVACGFHAGDPRIMEHSVRQAKAHGVGVGAHPGYPDRVGFGRRTMTATPDEIRTDVLYQIGALAAFCRAEGIELQHVKAHGALYNLAVTDASVATAIAAAVKQFDPDLIFFVLPGTELEAAGESAGLRLAREAFADRGYMPDGSLVPRSRPDAVITDHDLAVRRMVRLVREGVIEAVDGNDLHLRADTICLHSDTPTALAIARALRAGFDEAGITVEPVGSTLR